MSTGLPVPTAGEDEVDEALGSPLGRDAAFGRVSGPGC